LYLKCITSPLNPWVLLSGEVIMRVVRKYIYKIFEKERKKSKKIENIFGIFALNTHIYTQGKSIHI